MPKRSSLSAAALLALAWPAGVAAQDAHYWTYGYGPVGQLTEGTLVGGVEDLSAVYYNPAALALIEEPRFVIGLTSVEFALLEVLLRVAGQVVTREDLAKEVLGRRLTPYDRSIDVHISSLRRKLGHQAEDTERIKTVRGTGYIYALPPDAAGQAPGRR